MKQALQFGAGNIGRGFMGQLFWEAGYETCFVEYDQGFVKLLNEAGRYPLRLLDAYSGAEIDMTIDKVEAVHSTELGRTSEIFAEAAAVGTAVGVRNLEATAPLVATGIKKRIAVDGGPVDIFLCENVFGAGKILKTAVFELLSAEERSWAEANIGFVGTSVARMVPAPDKRFEKEGPLFVVADSYHKLPYDAEASRAPEPPIEGLVSVSNFRAEVERKLYTHNLGHAAMGYLGYHEGYTYVHETFEDEELLAVFDGALNETAAALVKRYPEDIDADEHAEIRKDVRIRFGNPLLGDPLTRVARDPLRKLGPEDRLVGSGRLCLDYEIFPAHIARVCGAAYRYDNPEDPAAVELQDIIADKGIEGALEEVSGLDPRSDFGRAVADAYRGSLPRK
ncbi:MAG: hypothetical protein ACLFRY_13955 [Spirochaetia bacterium]